MTDEKQKPKDETERWAKQADDTLAPPGTFAKGSHHYPSLSSSGTAYRSVPPLGHKPTFRKLRD